MDGWLELNNCVLSGTQLDINCVLSGTQLDISHDSDALQVYFQENINPNMVFFHDLAEKIRYLTEHGVWDKSLFERYTAGDVNAVSECTSSYKFRFKSFMGAFKFYNDYATRTPERSRWLERFEDRMAVTALARNESVQEALALVDNLVWQTFTPATPTLMNSGKANTGRLVSCFLLQDCTDNLESITKTLAFVAELSKGGGGIGVDVSNVRARGESLRNIQNVTKGVIGIAKLLDNMLRNLSNTLLSRGFPKRFRWPTTRLLGNL